MTCLHTTLTHTAHVLAQADDHLTDDTCPDKALRKTYSDSEYPVKVTALLKQIDAWSATGRVLTDQAREQVSDLRHLLTRTSPGDCAFCDDIDCWLVEAAYEFLHHLESNG